MSTKKLRVDAAHDPVVANLRTSLSSSIQRRRIALNLTQAALAERLNVDTETLSRFERGRHLPSLMTLVKLADIFGVTAGELLDEPEAREDDAARVMATWMAELEPQSKQFLQNMVRQWVDQLARQL